MWLAPDGWPVRRIDWHILAGQNRGSILFLAGRNDAYEKYLESLEQWHQAGWRVTALDWRGQAGSGRLGHDRGTGHIADFSVWIDDLAAFWDEWSQPGNGNDTPAPHILGAHSMGGHLALRAVAEKRVTPDAVFLSAPMLGFAAQPLPPVFMHQIARLMRGLGDPARPAWRWSEKPGTLPAGRSSILTHDADRYADEQWWYGARPELAMGPGSWQWVERAYASMKELSEPGVLEHIQVPVLILATRHDRLVSFSAARKAAERLPQGELIEFGKESHHEILREVDSVRNRAMDAIADFLDRVAPAPAHAP